MSPKKRKIKGISIKELDDCLSALSDSLEQLLELDKRKNAKNAKKGKKRGRQPKNNCLGLIQLDTAKIRKGYLKEYKRRKKVLEKLENQLDQYKNFDEPEYFKYLAQRFGAEQTRMRELSTQIHLCKNRLDKIYYLAGWFGMSHGRYCFTLKDRLTEGQDFWELVELELQKVWEQQQKEREKVERKYAERHRETHSADSEFSEDVDFDDFDDDSPFDDADEFKRLFDKLFEPLGGERDNSSEAEDMEENELKRLYRKLCLQYHPDRIGAHDAKTQRLWNDIQTAYNDHDLETLRAINAGIELESGKTEVSCSEIDDMLYDIEWSIQEKRDELREQKKTPFWGFASWSKEKRKEVDRDIKAEFDHDIRMDQLHLERLQQELESMLQWRPKEKKSSTRKKPPREEIPMDIPDLFEL